MLNIYRHSQIGYAMRTIMLVASAAALASCLIPEAPWPLLLVIGGVLAGAGWIFSVLTIEVTPSQLQWHFGLGVWKVYCPRADIASAVAVRNKWWYGFGAHHTSRGWLYNVGGLDAVEVALKDGTTFRLGTDEPQALARALSTT